MSWIAILAGMAIMFACPPLGVVLLIVIILIGIWQ